MHGTNENISIDNYNKMLKFYESMITNFDKQFLNFYSKTKKKRVKITLLKKNIKITLHFMVFFDRV